jgi:sulfur carrier protein
MEVNHPMNITLNGANHQTEAGATVTRLLESLDLTGKPVVVELDEQAVFPRDYDHTPLAEGARVEIVTLAAGG